MRSRHGQVHTRLLAAVSFCIEDWIFFRDLDQGCLLIAVHFGIGMGFQGGIDALLACRLLSFENSISKLGMPWRCAGGHCVSSCSPRRRVGTM